MIDDTEGRMVQLKENYTSKYALSFVGLRKLATKNFDLQNM